MLCKRYWKQMKDKFLNRVTGSSMYVDICSTCTKFLVNIRQTKIESKKEALQIVKRDKENHLRKAEVNRDAPGARIRILR